MGARPGRRAARRRAAPWATTRWSSRRSDERAAAERDARRRRSSGCRVCATGSWTGWPTSSTGCTTRSGSRATTRSSSPASTGRCRSRCSRCGWRPASPARTRRRCCGCGSSPTTSTSTTTSPTSARRRSPAGRSTGPPCAPGRAEGEAWSTLVGAAGPLPCAVGARAAPAHQRRRSPHVPRRHPPRGRYVATAGRPRAARPLPGPRPGGPAGRRPCRGRPSRTACRSASTWPASPRRPRSPAATRPSSATTSSCWARTARWLSDFAAAVEAGMAVEVPLPARTTEVADVVVAGVCLSLTPDDAGAPGARPGRPPPGHPRRRVRRARHADQQPRGQHERLAQPARPVPAGPGDPPARRGGLQRRRARPRPRPRPGRALRAGRRRRTGTPPSPR